MISHIQINKCDIKHSQNKELKSHDISIDVEKTFEKNQHCFMIKNSQQIKYRKNVSHQNKVCS